MSRRHFTAATLAAIVSCASLSAQAGNFQRIQSYESGIAADLETVCLDAGMVRLSPVDPLSDAEIRRELSRVIRSKLSANGRAAYDRLLSQTVSKPKIAGGGSGFSASVDLALQAYLRSNESIPWIYGYESRPSFLETPIEVWFGNNVYAYAAPALKDDPSAVSLPVAKLPFTNAVSFTTDSMMWDVTMPFRAFMSVGGDNWNFRIARDRISIGSAGDYNLTVSSYPAYYDYARFTLFADDLAYSAYAIQLSAAPVPQYFYIHRIDFRFADRLSLGVLEGTLVPAPMELRWLNPFMVFHNYFGWFQYDPPSTPHGYGVGSEFSVELNWNPWRYGELFLQGEMNGYDGWPKNILWPDQMATMPSSLSALAGAKLRYPIDKGYLIADLLGAYTLPYTYILESDYVSLIYNRWAPTNVIGGSPRDRQWIGFMEGPDSIFAKGDVGYSIGGLVSLSLDASWRLQGPNDINTPLILGPAAANANTPSGIAETRVVLGATLSYQLFDWLTAMASLHHTGRWNADNVEGAVDESWETIFSLALRF